MQNILIIKLGGSLLYNDVSIKRFFDTLQSYYHTYRKNILIVHGGNFWINNEIKKLDSSISHNPDNENTIKYSNINLNFKVNMFLNTINNYITEWAKKYYINAMGLCLNYKKYSHVNQNNIFPCYNSLKLIKYLFSYNIIPIINPSGIHKNNNPSVVEIPSDIVAMSLAIMLKARLIFLTDVSSILDGKGKCIKNITPLEAKKLIHQGIITNGMIEKINAAIRVSYCLKQSVCISGWQDLEKLKSLLQGNITGTQISFI
ncbi:hypothetical protein [Buchnera aphidicola]|uniref:Acetylglutamate kinase n=1 Tax=Buchnera aphidicola (Stegophylla sp.) TaxID=2315800 RepID=A0A4D6YKR7_9GAMM|nr:hypothetical protein [Buchnera aphidicola (Stegophylla sp.)]QCI26238.1 hypothetical protein D9V79_00195 [Buchnera aphidicola (Stegophylla sp.)]